MRRTKHIRNPNKDEPYEMKVIDALGLKESTNKIITELQDLYNILSYRRGAGSNGELIIIRRYIASLPGAVRDGFGNYHLQIPMNDGSASKVMWSCHTDTVHNAKGQLDRQKLHITAKGILGLADNQLKECLGADDGAGMWLMLQMIKRGVPGYYIFHRDEEHGRNGSKWAATNLQKECKFSELDFAIAFDRRGDTSVITYQSGSRCCSEEFSTSIAKAMEKSGIKYKSDPSGSFTDTASYVNIIKECTNLSVGYQGAHGGHETQDIGHLLMMREALLEFDESILVAKRDPTKTEYKSYNNNNGYHGYGTGYQYQQRQYKGMNRNYYGGENPVLKDRYRMARIVESHGLEIAEILQASGFDADLLYDLLNEMEMDGDNESKSVPDNVVHIGKKKDENNKTIEATVNEKTISQDLLDDASGVVNGSEDIPVLTGGKFEPPPFLKKQPPGVQQGPSNRPRVFKDKAQSSNEVLGEQVRNEAQRLSNEARMKVMPNVSQTGVYMNEELSLLTLEGE